MEEQYGVSIVGLVNMVVVDKVSSVRDVLAVSF